MAAVSLREVGSLLLAAPALMLAAAGTNGVTSSLKLLRAFAAELTGLAGGWGLRSGLYTSTTGLLVSTLTRDSSAPACKQGHKITSDYAALWMPRLGKPVHAYRCA
jgi:hypothetical protein